MHNSGQSRVATLQLPDFPISFSMPVLPDPPSAYSPGLTYGNIERAPLNIDHETLEQNEHKSFKNGG
jgi:hypothetical protein